MVRVERRMIQCKKCGQWLGKSPILKVSQIRDYDGPWWYWCARCDIRTYVDENDNIIVREEQ